MLRTNPMLALAAALAAGMTLATAASSQAADIYQVDPVHSTVVFRVKHMNVGYAYGRFNDVAGSITLDEEDPAKSSFDVQVKADSLDTANAKRDGHLRGPDFFSVKEFPVIRFKSTEVKRVKERTYEATGELTLHGVTKTITVPINRVGTAKDMRGQMRTGFEANFSVRRADYGMNFMPGALGDDIWLIVSFEAVRP